MMESKIEGLDQLEGLSEQFKGAVETVAKGMTATFVANAGGKYQPVIQFYRGDLYLAGLRTTAIYELAKVVAPAEHADDGRLIDGDGEPMEFGQITPEGEDKVRVERLFFAHRELVQEVGALNIGLGIAERALRVAGQKVTADVLAEIAEHTHEVYADHVGVAEAIMNNPTTLGDEDDGPEGGTL
jgi:hypothetical protein